MLIGEEFCMWDVARKKIYIVLVVSRLEGHGTTRNPKTFRFGEESCARSTLATDARDVLFHPYLGLGFIQAEKHERIHKRRQDQFLGEILLRDAGPSSGL